MKLIKRYKKQDNHYPMPDAKIRFIKPWFRLGAYSYTDYGCDGTSFYSDIPDGSASLTASGETMSLSMFDDECHLHFIGWLNQMIEDGYIEILNPEIFEWEDNNEN